MKNTKSQTFSKSTQFSDNSFFWNTSDLDNISLEIPKLKPEESKLVDKIFDEWLDKIIQILLSDKSEENKQSTIIEVTTNLASKITHPLNRVHFMLLVKERLHTT